MKVCRVTLIACKDNLQNPACTLDESAQCRLVPEDILAGRPHRATHRR